jgi:hypothetical protein
MSPESHAAIRAALTVADDIDPAGRLRIILHLLRCAGPDRVVEVLQLRLDDLLLRIPGSGRNTARPSSRLNASRHPHGAILLKGKPVALDEEGAQELESYLRRRRRRLRVRLDCPRGSHWYVHVSCAGGHVSRSLRTADKAEALRRLEESKRRLAQRARDQDSGWLVPMSYRRGQGVSVEQLRIWINQAVGRQANRQTRANAGGRRPRFRRKERLSRE